MKYLIISFFSFLVLACQPQNEESNQEQTTENQEATTEWTVFGDTIDTENVLSTDEMMVMVDESGTANVKLEGLIEEACQKKGCWMKVKIDGIEDPIRVTFKDYGFFVPLNSAGDDVIMEGVVKYDTVDIDVLKHYAEDAGKTQEEIDAISEPEINLAFEAVGVRIKDNS